MELANQIRQYVDDGDYAEAARLSLKTASTGRPEAPVMDAILYLTATLRSLCIDLACKHRDVGPNYEALEALLREVRTIAQTPRPPSSAGSMCFSETSSSSRLLPFVLLSLIGLPPSAGPKSAQPGVIASSAIHVEPGYPALMKLVDDETVLRFAQVNAEAMAMNDAAQANDLDEDRFRAQVILATANEMGLSEIARVAEDVVILLRPLGTNALRGYGQAMLRLAKALAP